MREILFRGKRIDNGEWVYGCLVHGVFFKAKDNSDIPYVFNIDDVDYDDFEDFAEGRGYYEVYPETVGQYTGLTDKNGKKIFEGDIYTWRDGGDYHACLICFGNYFDGYADRYATMARGFYVKPLDGGTFNFAGAGYSEIEISGNIHDNPELLEARE